MSTDSPVGDSSDMSAATLRWQVGEATVTAITESAVPIPPGFLFEGLTESDVLARSEAAPWLRPHFVDENGLLLQKIQCCVIETGAYRIAVDTCIGNDKPRANPFWAHLQGPFLDELAAAGFAPEQITHVICTHLHVDHVGWNTRLVGDEWVPTFPNAQYLFVETEFDHWRSTEGLFGDPVFADSIQPIVDAGLAQMVAPDHAINDEVRIESTPGHTIGHVSVAITSGGERAIITGDMAHSPLQLADPNLSSMYDTDPAAARSTRHAVLPGWADGKTLLIGTHFGAPTAGVIVQDGSGYKLLVD